MDHNSSALKEASLPKERLALFITCILSVLFTLGMYGAGFLLYLALLIIMNDLIPSPWTPTDGDPAVRAWLETLKSYALIALILLLILIIAGFLLKKFKISLGSSIILMLPILSYFSFAMTWLSGMSALMMLWLPIVNVSPELLALGDIFFAPFLVPIMFLWGISSEDNLLLFRGSSGTLLWWLKIMIPLLITTIGIGLFTFSITTWLYGKSQGKEIVTFWIYKYSHHPQYLGFLLTTYGLVILLGFVPNQERFIPAPSLFWLIAAMCVLSMAIREENRLLAKADAQYINWRAHTPFMMPLPTQVTNLIRWLVKLLIRKEWPESDKEILFIVFIYSMILILLSLPIIIVCYPWSPIWENV
ncbi:MAG: hypothetical protein ACFE9L_06795 [Candidatus Hodarchaeota archaeon]